MNPYVQEHIDLIQAIQNDTPLNEAAQVTDSTLTAIMGREAAYSGAAVEWNAILGNCSFAYAPEQMFSDRSKTAMGLFRTLKPPMPSERPAPAEFPMAVQRRQPVFRRQHFRRNEQYPVHHCGDNQ